MTLINSTKFLEFKSAVSPNGQDWFYVKRVNDKQGSDSAVVVTTLVKVENDYNFLFLKTKRPPIYSESKAEFCLESPAGLVGDIDKNETVVECAKKELKEEAGLAADNLYLELTNSATSAGLSSETLSYVTAIVNNDYQISLPINDGGIIVDRLYVKASDIYNYLNTIDTNTISISAPTICGVFYALNRLKMLTLR